MLPDYQLIRHFMNIMLEKIRGEIAGLPEETLEEYGRLINKLWMKRGSLIRFENGQTILRIAVTEGNINIISFILGSANCSPVFED